MKRVLFVSNTFDSLSKFRGNLILELIAKGNEVYAIAPDGNAVSGEGKQSVERLGAQCISIRLSPTSKNPLRDLRFVFECFRILRRVKPDVVCTYTIKPNIFAVWCARLWSRKVRIVSIMNGAGYAFLRSGWLGATLRIVVSLMYRSSFSLANRVVFHNEDDRREFVVRGIVSLRKSEVVGGSGVDLTAYPESHRFPERVTFILPARLIREKGVYDYVDAIRTLEPSIRSKATFQLLGPFYQAPNSVTREEVEGWEKEGLIRYLGEAANVLSYLEAASVVVLPSYREGLSRVLLEAMSIGRPIITCDTPGCRELVWQEENGRLVNPRDPANLAAALRFFIEHRGEIPEMGRRSRARAERDYDVRVVNSKLLSCMGAE